MPVPGPNDIRAFLDGYGFDTVATLALTGTWSSGNPTVANVNTTQAKAGDLVYSASGIGAGTRIKSIDLVDAAIGQMTLDTNPSAPGAGAAIQVTYYPVLRDGWLIRTRDNMVLPWITEKTRLSFNGIQTVTEFYDGTGDSILVLRKRPIVALISISYTNVDSNLYYLTPSAIQVIPEEGILKAKANFNESTYIPIFYRGTKNIKIVYQAGYADYPTDIFEAVCRLVAEQALAHIGSRTGGGDMSTQGYSRSFGKSGKWTHERRMLAQTAYSSLRKYMTGAGS
jgi:hypothetical protein